MYKPEFPKKLSGIILIYTDGGNPSVRVFSKREDLVAWVGEWHLTWGRSDSHWVDGVVTGTLDLIDESIHLSYHDEQVEPVGEENESEGSAEVLESNGAGDGSLDPGAEQRQ